MATDTRRVVFDFIARDSGATRTIREIGESADRTAVQVKESATDIARGGDRMESAFNGAGAAADEAGEKITRAQLAARDATLAAESATDRAERAQRRAADAAQQLARGEIDEARAAELAAKAERAVEKASIARTKAALAATAAIRAETAAAEDQADASEEAGQAAESSALGMAALGATAAAMAGGMLAAGAAAASFGLLARSAISTVLEASQDLTGAWETLDTDQRSAALGVVRLTDAYDDLSEAVRPQSLAAFNSAVGSATMILPEFGKLAERTGDDVLGLVNRVGAFASGPQMRSFLRTAGDAAPQALDDLGASAVSVGELALQVAQDAAPLGLSMLTLARGGLAAANAMAHLSPTLTQLAVAGLLLRGPVSGLIGGVGAMTTRMKAASAATVGMSKGARLMGLATAGLPGLAIAAGVGIGFLALKVLSAKSGLDHYIDSLRESTKATGNNIQGYEATATILRGKYATAVTTINQLHEMEAKVTGRSSLQYGGMVEKARDATNAKMRLEAEMRRLNTSIANVTIGTSELAGRYHITTGEARRLADAAGVDLSKSIDKQGHVTQAAATRIDQYRLAALQAKDSNYVLSEAFKTLTDETATADQKTKALTTSYNQQLGPALTMISTSMQLIDGWKGVTQALGKARQGTRGNSDATRQLIGQVTSQIDTVWKLYAATNAQDGNNKRASARVREQLPLLYALAGRNTALRDAVNKLAGATGNNTSRQNLGRDAFLKVASSMHISRDAAEKLWKEYSKIPKHTADAGRGVQSFSVKTLKALREIPSTRSLDINVDAHGHYGPAGKGAHWASGGGVPAHLALGPGGPTSDDVPGWLSVDEHVWTARETAAVGGHRAMEHLRQAALRGELNGWAGGGAIHLRAHTPDPSGTVRQYGEMHRDLERSRSAAKEQARVLAAAWKKEAQSGGGVVAAARSMIGYPYSWGGGGLGGPSYGIGRGSNTYGFDCSGLTQYAWGKGRGIDIGGVTDTQWATSSPISGPRPGAIAFPSGPSVHVVLGSDRPGYIIQAPYTGSYVQEVPRSSGNWRWPRGAGLATGGPVEPLAHAYVAGLAQSGDAKRLRALGIAGDPGRRRADGGDVAAGLAYLVGEQGPEVWTPRSSGTVHPAGSTVIVNHNHYTVNVPTAYHKGQVGKELRELLAYDAKNGGTNPYARRAP